MCGVAESRSSQSCTAESVIMTSLLTVFGRNNHIPCSFCWAPAEQLLENKRKCGLITDMEELSPFTLPDACLPLF